MRWDDLPQVKSPVGRTLVDLLAEGPRRQDLPGYDPVYRDFVDYIIRCTHRIWEQKNVGLCRSHYAADCAIHTLAGPVTGVEAVVRIRSRRWRATPDRLLIGEDVIWSDDGAAGLYSSHRIVSRSTHMGDDPLLGDATMLSNGVMTIADCLCRENRIVEEWLVRDNLRGVLQVGAIPWALARAQAAADSEGDQARHGWRQRLDRGDARRSRRGHAGRPSRRTAPPRCWPRHGATICTATPRRAVPACEIRWPTNRHGYGRGYWIGCLDADHERAPRCLVSAGACRRATAAATAMSQSRCAGRSRACIAAMACGARRPGASS